MIRADPPSILAYYFVSYLCNKEEAKKAESTPQSGFSDVLPAH